MAIDGFSRRINKERFEKRKKTRPKMALKRKEKIAFCLISFLLRTRAHTAANVSWKRLAAIRDCIDTWPEW